MFKERVTILISSLMLVFLVSCGGNGNQYMKGVSVKTQDVGGDTYLSVDAKLDIQNLLLAEVMIPVYRKGVQIGTVNLGQDILGGNHVGVELNMSEIVDFGYGVHKLPNGLAIPLLGTNPSIKIPTGKGVDIYLIKTESVLGLAVTVGVKEFDGLGRSIGTTGIFPLFNVDSVTGATGIYTSQFAGKNGIALAFNLSSFLPAKEKMALRSGMILDKAEEEIQLDYDVKEVGSKRQRRKLGKKLYRLNKKKAELHVQ